MMRIALVLLFCGISFSGYGQNLGIFFTKNGTKLNGDKPQGFRIAYDQGFAFGIILDLKVDTDVELSIQPGYHRLQSTVKVPDNDNPDIKLKDTLDFRLDYFSVPILAKIQPLKTDRLYFITGPQVGFLLESKTTGEDGQEKNQDDLINNFNLSLNFGLGYKFPVKSTWLVLEARYQQGLLNITDFGNPEELFSRVKVQGVNVSLAFILPFRPKSNE